MQKLTDHRPKQLQRKLDGLVYRNPDGECETADRYLSGDVLAKLRTAEGAATINQFYQCNVQALKEVQLVDLLPGDSEPPGFRPVLGAHPRQHGKIQCQQHHGLGTPRALASDLIDDALNPNQAKPEPDRKIR